MNMLSISAILAMIRCELPLHFRNRCSNSSLRSSSIRSPFAAAPTWKMHPSGCGVFLCAMAPFARRSICGKYLRLATTRQYDWTANRRVCTYCYIFYCT